MPSKKLSILIALIIVLSAGHDIDHFIRGDFRSQLRAQSNAVYAILVTKYAFLGAGFYLYLKNKVGPLPWAIVAGIGVVLGALAHFSPLSEQTPQAIYRAYATPAAGVLAVSALSLLMLALAVTAAYAQRLWAKGGR